MAIKISIVCGYYYPQNTPRSFRAAELAEEFARRGNEVVVYTITGDHDYSEYTAKTKVMVRNLGNSRLGIADTFGVCKRNAFLKVINKLFSRVLFLPYIEIIPMIRRRIKEICKDADMIITIAHPYSTHWGMALAKHKVEHFPLWVSDCGDPFMGDPFEKYPFYFKCLEKKWGKETDYITIPIEEGRTAYYPEVRDKIKIIPQGFRLDPIRVGSVKNDVPTFAYAGALYPNQRDPREFLDYLMTLKTDFKFIVYSGQSVKKMLSLHIEQMKGKLEVADSMPRKELLKKLATMDFLVNINNLGGVQQPSKLIDYAIASRPVLDISTHLKESEQMHTNEFLHGDYTHKKELPDLSRYNIINVADAFLGLTD